MKNVKKKIWLSVFGVSMLLTVLVGCKEVEETEPPKEKKGLYQVDEQFEKQANNMIQEVFSKMFKEDFATLYNANVRGEKLEFVKPYLSKQAEEKELPVQYPRFVELQGLTMVGYELYAEDEKPSIQSRFYERQKGGEAFAFLVEVVLKAKVLKNVDFPSYVTVDEAGLATIASIPQALEDDIRVKARYDVLVVKEEGKPKIEVLRESNSKQNAFRLNKINNDFMERLPYYPLESLGNNQQYQKETAFVTNFFDGLMKKLDQSETVVAKKQWDIGALEFAAKLQDEGVLGTEKDSFFSDLFTTDAYRTRFHKDILPLKAGMSRVNGVEITVTQFPSFTRLNKTYRVVVEAFIEPMTGGIKGQQKYQYDYTTTLDEKEGVLSIREINLNAYKQIQD